MFQSKPGMWIVGACVVVLLISIGYGMGRRAGQEAAESSRMLTPAGAPLPAIQVEPIQPQEELAAIAVNPSSTSSTTASPIQTADAFVSPASLEGSARIREIQSALKSAGFNPGPVDGKMGQQTKTAVRDFQTANGLQADGKVGPKTWSKLETYLAKNTQSSSNQ